MPLLETRQYSHVGLVSLLWGITIPFPWVLMHIRFLFAPCQEWSLFFPQYRGSPAIQSHWPSKLDSLGIPSPFTRSSGGEARFGVKTFTTSLVARTSLVLLFSCLWVAHPLGMGFYFIVIVPLLPSHCSFSFIAEHGVSFLVGPMGFPGGASGKEPTCQCRRHKRHSFHPWVGKIPWRRAWQLTPVFLPGESHGQRNLVGYSP